MTMTTIIIVVIDYLLYLTYGTYPFHGDDDVSFPINQ